MSIRSLSPLWGCRISVKVSKSSVCVAFAASSASRSAPFAVACFLALPDDAIEGPLLVRERGHDRKFVGLSTVTCGLAHPRDDVQRVGVPGIRGGAGELFYLLPVADVRPDLGEFSQWLGIACLGGADRQPDSLIVAWRPDLVISEHRRRQGGEFAWRDG